jgi:hypothetical protein
MAKKLLEINKQEKTYAICPECNTLYKVSKILPQNLQNVTDQLSSGFKCTHVAFSNHPRYNQKQACREELTKKVPIVNGFVRRPKMLFPIPSLKKQIIMMYQRPGFERSLQKWANQESVLNLYADIYDGKVWKSFPSSLDNLEAHRFFTNEMVDSHLGIMINLNWF